MKRHVDIEVCIDSVESAIAALEGGADRVELCADIPRGGTTPSIGLIEEVRAHCSLPLHVLIRPRAGNFCYSSHEIRTIERDIDAAKRCGADAVVLGILRNNGDVDVSRLRAMIERARPMHLTFHRAFDVARDPLKALDDAIGCGVDMLLTSGQQPVAEEGIPLLAELVRRSSGRIGIIAGSGVTKENGSRIVDSTNVSALHVGSGVSEELPLTLAPLFNGSTKRVSSEFLRRFVASVKT